ncbi:hypothetical protein [Arthrobacter pityocampae]|uniref:hypothetical protein n=1 Tax=Arthrobacter pityocampae TaxID=547334 RepID=UPI003735DAB6
MSELTDRVSVADALVLAVRDIRARIAGMDNAAVALELDRLLTHYWGPEHGITAHEMLATARDIKRDAESRQHA